jgi:hypothetical protein
MGNDFCLSNFGCDVDYAVHYLNTAADPVPTTNYPLSLCICVNVMGVKELDNFVLPEGETMHCWSLT